MSNRKSRQADNILGIEDPDMTIYRVFTLERLFDTLVTKKLALVRPRLWDDPFENFLYQFPLTDKDGRVISLESLRNRLYGQCWTKTSVSDALWRIYSPYKSGVRAKTTVRKLIDAIWRDDEPAASLRYFIGEVKYAPREKLLRMLQSPSIPLAILDSTGHGPVESLLLKRKAFDHEKEVRLIFQDSRDSSDDVVFCPIEPNSLFDSLLFDPRMDPTTVATFTEILRKIGFKNRISQSTLYNSPMLKGHIV